MKKNNSNVIDLTADELLAKIIGKNKSIGKGLPILVCFSAVILITTTFVLLTNLVKTSNMEEGFTLISGTSAATSGAKKDLISIPAGTVKANPFLPYRNIGDASSSASSLPSFELIAPPEVISEDSEAARVMDTIVSGILYDKCSPSAILNIEGNDYLVKKGDVVNNYKVLDIARDSVTVKLGSNTYKAGIGEILTEGSVNYNDVSNLSKKFGGEKR